MGKESKETITRNKQRNTVQEKLELFTAHLSCKNSVSLNIVKYQLNYYVTDKLQYNHRKYQWQII